eukprot:6175074-Pleurochrysis_carterae.AAC.3
MDAMFRKRPIFRELHLWNFFGYIISLSLRMHGCVLALSCAAPHSAESSSQPRGRMRCCRRAMGVRSIHHGAERPRCRSYTPV